MAIREKAKANVTRELNRLGIPQTNFSNWERGKFEPKAFYLQTLAMGGYDIVWILTGDRVYHTNDVDFDIAEYEEDE